MKLKTACPKPSARKPKERKQPKKTGVPRVKIAYKNRRTRPKSKGHARDEFRRVYHSEARRIFVSRLPCIVCKWERCEGHHIETGGVGRKADYVKIVPLCNSRYGVVGHHREYHDIGRETFQRKYPHVNLELAAIETERRWSISNQNTEQSKQKGEVE